MADYTVDDTIGADGTLDLRITPFARQNWLVRQCSTYAPNVGGAASAEVWRDTTFHCVIGAQRGTAVEPPPLLVGNGQKLRVRYAGATPGANVQVTLVYDEV